MEALAPDGPNTKRIAFTAKSSIKFLFLYNYIFFLVIKIRNRKIKAKAKCCKGKKVKKIIPSGLAECTTHQLFVSATISIKQKEIRNIVC
jgi:hypothetical protein